MNNYDVIIKTEPQISTMYVDPVMRKVLGTMKARIATGYSFLFIL